jgi:hypothetical protein
MNIKEYVEFKAKQAAVGAANTKIMSLRSSIEDATGEPALSARCFNFSQFSPQAAAELILKLEAELAKAGRPTATATATASPTAAAAHKPIHVNVPAHHLRSKAAAPPAGPDLATLEKLAGQIFNGAWRSHRYDELDEAGKMAFLRKEFFQAHIEIPGGITDGEAKERKIWRTAELTGLPKAVRHARQEVADKFFQNKNHEGA